MLRKPGQPLTSDIIGEFCMKFDEGLRVEYKGIWNEDVKAKLPKVVSSFANTRGGVLIIGVNTDHEGRATPPIEGFAKPTKEDIRLTIENICYTSIYPPVTPLITLVDSHVGGNMFVALEVEESPEVPHAINQGTAVYIRTGSASRKTRITLEALDQLIKRRDGVLKHREQFQADAIRIQQKVTPATSFPKVRIVIGPRFPHSQLTDRDSLYRSLSRFTYGQNYPQYVTRRMPRGAVWFRHLPNYGHKKEFGYVDTLGQVFDQYVLDTGSSAGSPTVCYLREALEATVQILRKAGQWYSDLDYRGTLSIYAEGTELSSEIEYRWSPIIEEFRRFTSYGETVSAEAQVAAERLRESLADVAGEMAHHLFWPLDSGHSFTLEQWRAVASEIAEQQW